MAEDTRKAQGITARPSATAAGGISSMPSVAPENANLLPGAGINTAGGKAQEASFVDAIKSIQISDFKEVYKKPCVRDSFMTGIGGGFAVGGVRAIMGATIFGACNWAVGTFCLGSFLMHEFCQRKRSLEKQGMKRAVEVMDRKQAERRQIAIEAREARKRKQDQS